MFSEIRKKFVENLDSHDDIIDNNITSAEKLSIHDHELRLTSNNGKNLSGFVECFICNLSFYGTNDTLDMHMNDVHQNRIQYIEAQNGEEIFQVFINDGIV